MVTSLFAKGVYVFAGTSVLFDLYVDKKKYPNILNKKYLYSTVVASFFTGGLFMLSLWIPEKEINSTNFFLYQLFILIFCVIISSERKIKVFINEYKHQYDLF
jgi:hypothetical protein